MEWLADLAGAGAAVASGGITGLIGSIIGAGAKFLERREVRKEKAADRAHEIALQELQMRARSEETEREIDLAQVQGSFAGLAASISADSALTGSVSRWVNDVRALFRPVLTVGALILLAIVFFQLGDGGSLVWFPDETDIRAELIAYVVNSIAFVATLAVAWWFGDRSLTPPDFKNR